MQKLAWKKRKEEEGEMGVGTLLIFIAMILVAAVAAGVLVQTVYKLASQAGQTGDEALKEVATGVKVVDAWGKANADHTQLVSLHIKIGLVAGSPEINLNNMIVEVYNGSSEVSLVCGGDAGTGSWSASQFNVSQVRDVFPSNTWTADVQGLTGGDMAWVNITLAISDGTNQVLVTQSQMSILLIPKQGVPTYFAFTVPSVISNDIVPLT